MNNYIKTIVSGLKQWVSAQITKGKSDWNQNDSNATNYVKNRTHYTERKEVTLFSSSELNDIAFVLTYPLVEGNTYTVVFNDVTYECVAKNYDGYLMIGNNAIYEYDNGVETDTGEPFAIECAQEDNYAYISFADTITEAPSISISTTTEIHHKIDEKYLPDMNYVSYKEYQGLTEDEMAIARENIGAFDGDYDNLYNKPTIYTDVVRYSTTQSLNDSNKERARKNIGAGTSNFSGSYNDLTDIPEPVHVNWEENDSTQADYIVGRTHYVEQVESELINSIAASTVATGPNVTSYWHAGLDLTSEDIELTENTIIKFVRTGVQDSIVAAEVQGKVTHYYVEQSGDYNYYVVGNQSLLNGITTPAFKMDFGTHEDTGEAYAIVVETCTNNGTMLEDYPRIYVIANISWGSARFKIYTINESVTPLDVKYIPDEVAMKSDVSEALAEAKAYSDSDFDIVGSDTITWDGDKTGRFVLDDTLVKVSDASPTETDMANGVSYVVDMVLEDETSSISGELLYILFDSGLYALLDPSLGEEGMLIGYSAIQDYYENETLVFESGFYLFDLRAIVGEGATYEEYSVTINGYTGFQTKKLKAELSHQSDWSQNDATKPDYIKNRTHWAEAPVTTTEVILQERNCEFTDGYCTTGASLYSCIEFVDGAELTIIWDGIEYASIANEMSFDGMSFVVLGNPKILDIYENAEDNGQPFAIAFSASDMTFTLMSNDLEATEHTIEIKKNTTTQEIYKLDNKYLNSEWMAQKSFSAINFISETSVTVTPDGVEVQAQACDESTIASIEYFQVNWSGEVYKCKKYKIDIMGYTVFGNLSMMDESFPNTNEPFLFILMGGMAAVASQEEVQVTFSVSAYLPSYTTLPNEYLPERLLFGTEYEAEVHKNEITWDGDISDKLVIFDNFYKVSNATPTYSDLLNGGSVSASSGTNSSTTNFTPNEVTNNDVYVTVSGGIFVFPQQYAFYEAGIYFYKGDNYYISSFTINNYTFVATETQIRKISAEYLPEYTNDSLEASVVNLNTLVDEVNANAVKVVPQTLTDEQKSQARFNIGASSATNLMNGSANNSLSSSRQNNASGVHSIALGYGTHATGYSSIACGSNSTASGDCSHAEGWYTTASGNYSHSEGGYTTASGNYSHSEGNRTTASGDYSHAEGWYTASSGDHSHVEGYSTTAIGINSHAEGTGKFNGYLVNITGEAESTTYTLSSHSVEVKAGRVICYDSNYARIESYDSSTLIFTTDKTLSSTSLQSVSAYILDGVAYGDGSHSEGSNTSASNNNAHSEGLGSIASGKNSHAEGRYSTASGDGSHAEGWSKASGTYSHSEGDNTTASGDYSHSEGDNTIASGDRSHSEGYGTIASGNSSHAEGYYTRAGSIYQHVQGKYNIEDTSKTYAHIVGNGESDTKRSNAHTLDWDGNAWFAGNISMAGNSLILADAITGTLYKIQIQNGQLVSFPVTEG